MKRKFLLFNAWVIGFLCSTVLHAASVTYLLDDTNLNYFTGSLPDGGNYLTVTMDNNGADPGIINFTVDVLTVSEGGDLVPTTMFGIQAFAFNLNELTANVDISASDIINLPTGTGGNTDWEVAVVSGNGPDAGNIKPTNGDGYGRFDIFLSDGGMNRVDPLTFSIAVDGDTFDSYFAPSEPTLGQDQPNVYFAAHVAGIETGAYTTDGQSDIENQCDPLTDDPCIELPSGWFGAGDEGFPPSAIPIPATVWLFGSGLLGLIVVARRKTVE